MKWSLFVLMSTALVAAGADRPRMPEVSRPVLFNTVAADEILRAFQVFPPDNPWNEDISALPVHPSSEKLIAGIGAARSLQYNLDMSFIIVPPDQKRVPVKLVAYPRESDEGPYPIPDDAPIENWPLDGRTLASAQTAEERGDRHVLVVDPVNRMLYEFYQGRKTENGWQAACEATFDLKTNALRPAGWTSSDAAGLPIFPAIVRFDECERGLVEHAMRFTVRRTRRAYVYPATHHASRLTDETLPRMGERFRLRQNFDVSGFSPHSQAILKGLKKYGMFVADNGGDWRLSVAPDSRIQGLNELRKVKGSDFEVVQTTRTSTVLRGVAAADPAELPRAEICLNGAWETVRNAGGEAVPAAGWSPRRVPELPIAGGDPPTTSIWYRLRLSIPRAWFRPDRRFVLTLEKVGHYAAVHCNGRQVAEHYGQFTPFEADLTAALQPGAANEIAIFVHDASGQYARPGAVIDDPREGNAYRGATDRPEQRNWVGIVGDILLSWRPATALADVQVISSLRNHRLEARVDTSGIRAERGPVTLRAAVLDDSNVVVQMPEKTLTGDGLTSLEAGWSNPVLWGPEPYGTPKLYVLRTELLQGGVVVDRRFTRFGFREVWVEGRDVLLNGKKLWMAGTYHGKLAPIGYLNDRHPQALALEVMQESGLNTLHGHWDDLGTPWLDRCDEMGMLVLAGFYCDGRPQIQSRADSGWEDWMADTCTQWTRTVRRHPSIVLWRPIDIGPVNAMARSRELFNRLAERVRREDGTRPFVFGNDGSEVDAWSQSPLKDPRDKTAYDDGARMVERFTGSPKPFLTKEIYTGFADVENVSRFFRTFSEKSFALGGTGLIVQHLPLVTRSRPFAIEWLSPSGRGNRDTAPRLSQGNLPNWCDASEPAWTPSPYSSLFRELATRFQKSTPAASRGERAGEVLVSGLAVDDLALLVPRDPAAGETVGVRAAADGTAWIAPPRPGEYEVFHERGSQPIQVKPRQGPRLPGYGDVERVAVAPN